MQQTNLVQKLLLSRLRILNSHGFYGLLLMQMRFGIDDECQTAYTDGKRICFNSEFLDRLSNDELDFVLMHEVLHVALGHCNRGLQYNQELFNIACDIVINSNILLANNNILSKITIDGSPVMHQLPDGREGHLYTAEEVYSILVKSVKKKNNKVTYESEAQFDDHGKWSKMSKEEKEELEHLVNQAIEITQSSTNCGSVPLGLMRKFKELKDPTLSWKELINETLSFELNDYSFAPPDRRYEGDFFLPDFNVYDLTTEEVFCFIDCSGSVSDDDLTEAFSEINGALTQYNGKIKLKLIFFDDALYEPVVVGTTDELLKVTPRGGGGTNFINVFDYIDGLTELPKAMIILTDAYAEFPSKDYSKELSVIWLINNNTVTPPWGKIARFNIR